MSVQDLEFKRRVSDVGGAAKVPEFQSDDSRVDTHQVPAFGQEMARLGEANNWMSAIGSTVAAKASEGLAKTLGAEAGKNPSGDTLLPAMTDFDKHFAESYETQAHATIGLEANKLITDSNIELSKASRITPEMIAKQQKEVGEGLQGIFEQAPSRIKPALQLQYGQAQLAQSEQLAERMIREQRQDRRDTAMVAAKTNAEQAHYLALSGKTAAAEAAVESTARAAQVAAEQHVISKEEAKVQTDTVRISYQSGKITGEALLAEKERRLPEFYKSLADRKDIRDSDRDAVLTNVMHYMTQQQSLKEQNENLQAQKMITSIATNAGNITGAEWSAFEESVSPLKAEQVKFKYIQALKAQQASGMGEAALMRQWGNPEAQANAGEKLQNSTFNKSVMYTEQEAQKMGGSISHEEAQVQVAASAGAKIPVFTNELKNKLHSSNPAYIESAAQQIHMLEEMHAGHALAGLSDEDHALYTQYESLRDSMDPTEAARITTDNILNQDPAVQEMTKQKLSNFLSVATTGGIPLDTFALSLVSKKKGDFINDSMAQVYGTDILNKFTAFYQITKGDQANAIKLTKKFVDENYGETYVNGGSYQTLHPLEKVLGFESKDAVPYIQQDVIDQFNKKLLPVKEAYAANKTNEYWETLPISGKDKAFFGTDYGPVQVKRHMRTTSGEKVDTFNVVLHGNSFDSWDVAIDTGSGMRNLFQVAPFLDIVTYKPDAKAIRASYIKDHSPK